ncbi:MAG: oligoribonuclease [Pseudomonadales bacterium]|nr:oligoribonuclease [Pseudomonadales bacterium]
MAYSENLVWMDLEMSGLDPEKERILEIATIITDSKLNIVAEGPVIVVQQPKALLDAMDEWNTSHHNASGLVDKVMKEGVSEHKAEQATLDFIKQYVAPGESPLCGNSIGQDRRFLVKYMPTLESYLHYRNLDVSTVKELCVRWRPEVYESLKKHALHRALDDIRDSISELRHYREHFFRV